MNKSLFVTSILLISILGYSASITVDDDGPADFTTIQAAIDAAAPSDVVILQPGTYTGNGNRDIDFLGKAITVQSIDPYNSDTVESTIIDCQGSSEYPRGGFIFQNNENELSVLSGLTITNAFHDKCIASALPGGTRIESAVFCLGSSPSITHCIFKENTSQTELGCCADCGCIAESGGAGIFCMMGSPKITNCIFYLNRALQYSNYSTGGGRGASIFAFNLETQFPRISNCVFFDNHAESAAGAVASFSMASEITNCIVYNNSPDDAGIITFSTPRGGCLELPSSADFNILQSNSMIEGQGNFYGIDPIFVDAGNHDFHISLASPAIDAGDPNFVLSPDAKDIDGQPRVVNGRIDIGVDESASDEPFLICAPKYIQFFAKENRPNPAPATLSVWNTGIGTIPWNLTENGPWLTAQPANGIAVNDPNDVLLKVDTTGLVEGQYNCQLEISESGGAENPQIVNVQLTVQGPTIELSETAFIFKAIPDGSNPADQTLAISNSGGGTLNWTIDEACSWLTIAPTSGSCVEDPNVATLQVNSSTLLTGTYHCQATVSSPSAENGPQTIDVTLLVGTSEFGLSATVFQFNAREGGDNPVDQTLTISNTGMAILQWQLDENCPWLTTDKTSGGLAAGTSEDVLLNVDTTGLAAAPYSCQFTLSDLNAANSPQTITVNLVVISSIITVDDDGPADFSTIQAAIDVAEPNDIIIVKDGVYTGPGNQQISLQEKTLTLKSENGPTNCTIDCQSETDCFAFLIELCDPVIEGFTIIRCSKPDFAPAITIWASNGIIKNCIFNDNAACIYSWGANAKVINCTFYGNTAGAEGGAVGMSTNVHNIATFTVHNSVLWDNEPTDIDFDFLMCKTGVHPGMSVEFTMLESNWQNQTLLTFENCTYGQDPNFADPDNGDFHLKSQMGRWEDFSQQWVKDSVTSPGLDLGDPNDDFSNELWPHGRRINAGAYGNTTEASLSVICKGTPADIDTNDSVNLVDYSHFAANWESNRVPNRNDYNRDNAVNMLDLVQLSQDWLTLNIDPVLTLNKAVYAIDETIEISFADMPGNQFDWIGICQKGESIEPFAGAMLRWSYTDGTETGTVGITEGTVSFDGMVAGDYEARIFFDGNYEIKDRVFFVVE